jgi:hypothetical protein
MYSNYEGTKLKEKIKFKGIPNSALINGSTYNMDIIKEAYQRPGEITAVL